MSTGGKKVNNTYEEAQRQYLEAGKKYSSLLREAMDLDPGIVKIAEEILITGDNISVHDNKLLTRFYNELRAGSKIDKKYYDTLVGLKKAKNELDIATRHLMVRRVGKILDSAGIPPRKSTYSQSSRVSHINNKDVSLLEKISLPGILSLDLANELADMTAGGELVIGGGKIVPQSKSARDFLKKLEKEVRQTINDEHFLGRGVDILKSFADIEPRSDIVTLIRAAADREHIREIERRIDAGDIYLDGDNLIAENEKGSRYLNLLSEELTKVLDTKTSKRLSSINQEAISRDPRLERSRKAVDALQNSLAKHERPAALAGGTVYNELLARATAHRGLIESKLASLTAEIETISHAFLDIKKRLIKLSSKNDIDVPALISLLVASRHLSKYEADYARNISELEKILGISSEYTELAHTPSADYLAESTCPVGCKHLGETNELIGELIASRITARKPLGDKMGKLLADFVLAPDQVEKYKQILCKQTAIREHITDADYSGGSLYLGIGGLSFLLEELVELEVERRELLADFVHEFELAHKELWLANIKNSNRAFMDSNYPDLLTDIRDNAVVQNSNMVANARQEVRKVIDKYRLEHKTSSETFGQELKAALETLKKNGNVVETANKLKIEYKKMLASHEKALGSLEIEISVLERRLAEFESGSKKDLEKVLLADIRRKI